MDWESGTNVSKNIRFLSLKAGLKTRSIIPDSILIKRGEGGVKCGMRNCLMGAGITRQNKQPLIFADNVRSPEIIPNSSFLTIIRERDNFGASVFLSGNDKVLNQRLERALKKRVQARVGIGCQPLLSQLGGDGVEVFLRTAVSVTASRKAANVSIEFGRNVPQFVSNCSEPFREVVQVKSRQIKIEQIQGVGAGDVLNFLNNNLTSAASRRSFSVLESKRSERGVHAVSGIVASLAESNSNPVHVDMIQRRDFESHVPTNCRKTVGNI